MIASLLLAVANVGGSCAVPASELVRQASLPYAAFDLGQGQYGWRRLSNDGCVDSAVAELQAYAEANADRLGSVEKMELFFHAGQALAFAAREAESVVYFERALTLDVSPEWSAYVQATLAFLKRDTEALRAARERYTSVAPTSMRLQFIDGMIACPTKPYTEAVLCAL